MGSRKTYKVTIGLTEGSDGPGLEEMKKAVGWGLADAWPFGGLRLDDEGDGVVEVEEIAEEEQDAVREALEWYADPANYRYGVVEESLVGLRARTALAGGARR